MLRNDQMIAQVLANMQDLNNQINRNLNILSELDYMHSESHGGSMNLHDQVSHIREGHTTLNNGLRSARSVHGVLPDGTDPGRDDVLGDRTTI